MVRTVASRNPASWNTRQGSMTLTIDDINGVWTSAECALCDPAGPRQGLGTALRVAAALTRAVRSFEAERGAVLLVATTDLSQHQQAEEAARLDALVRDRVAAFDPRGLMTAVTADPGLACGAAGVAAVLDASSALGATVADVVAYGTSGDVTGDTASVAGYLSAVVR